MKRKFTNPNRPPKISGPKEPVRTRLRQEGKLVHGTKGKPTHGPRGNKRY